jgi:hypothetical protein
MAERADTHLYGRPDPLSNVLAPKIVDYTIIPLTQAILEGYGANAVSPAQLATFPLATLSDFRANISYDTAWRIGVINIGTAEAPIYEERFELKRKYALVSEGLLKGLIEYMAHVRAKNAYNVQTAGQETTVPAWTTIPPATTIPGTTVPATTVPPVTTTVPAGALILDLYPGALGAYSIRKLRSAQTLCLRARRSTDNTEQDFGFVNNMLDTTSLLTFAQGANAYAVRWYDQSGTGNDITSSAQESQPILVLAGVLRTTNGKATVDLDTNLVPRNFAFPLGFLNGAANLSYFQVAKITEYGSSNAGIIGPYASNSAGLEILQLGTSPVWLRSSFRLNGPPLRNASGAEESQLWNDAVQTLTSIFGNPTDVSAYKNGVAVVLSDISPMAPLNYNGVYALGYYNASVNNMYGDVQELIIYNTNQKPNRAAIEANIAAHYGVPINLTFTTRSASLVTDGNGFVASGAAAHGLDVLTIGVGEQGRIVFPVNHFYSAWLGFNVNNTLVDWSGMLAGVATDSGGILYTAQGGVYTNHGTIIPNGTLLSIKVGAVGAPLIAQTSTDGIHFTDLFVFSAVRPSGVLYINTWMAAGMRIDNVKLKKPDPGGTLIVFDVASNLTNAGGIWSDTGSGGNGYRSVPFNANSKFRIYFKYMGATPVITFGLKTVAAASDYTTMALGWVSSGGDIYPVNAGALQTAQGSVANRWYGILVENGVAKAQISADGLVWTDVVTLPTVYNVPLYVMVFMNASGSLNFPKVDMF